MWLCYFSELKGNKLSFFCSLRSIHYVWNLSSYFALRKKNIRDENGTWKEYREGKWYQKKRMCWIRWCELFETHIKVKGKKKHHTLCRIQIFIHEVIPVKGNEQPHMQSKFNHINRHWNFVKCFEMDIIYRGSPSEILQNDLKLFDTKTLSSKAKYRVRLFDWMKNLNHIHKIPK